MLKRNIVITALAGTVAGSAMGASCGGEDPFTNETTTGAQGLPKGQGGSNGANNFCTNPAAPCVSGEGDCDGDVECDTGLVCGFDIGDLFGFSSAVDVCVFPHCVDGTINADEEGLDCGGADCGDCGCTGLPANGLAGRCSPRCPCPSGEGDCDTDADCESGFVCGTNNGDQFGFDNSADICVPASCTNGIEDGAEIAVDCGGSCGPVCQIDCSSQPPNGNINHCSESCPCPAQEGDCDNDLQCQMGTECNLDVGDEFGFSSATDICLANTCDNGVQDGDEADVDCGPSCLPCPGGVVAINALGGVNLEEVADVGIDGSGNIYVIGKFRTSTDLGGGTLTAAAGSSATADEIFLAKFDANGNHIWSDSFGGDASDGDRGLAIAVNRVGDVAITGSYRRSIDFGGGSLTTPTGANAFVAAFDTAGNHIWSSQYGNAGVDDSGTDIVFDRNGRVVVIGFFEGTVDFGGGNLTSNGARDVFVARYDDNTGAHRNSISFGGPSSDAGNGVAADSRGRVYITGSFRNTVQIGPNQFSNVGSDDMFVALVGRTSFSINWSAQFGGPNNDSGRSVTVDDDRRVTVGGYFSGSVPFGTTTATSAGALDAVVLGLDGTDGSVRYSVTFGSTNDDLAISVAADPPTGDVFVAGAVTSTVANFPGGSSSGLGGADSFLLEFDSTGSYVSGERDGGTGLDQGTGVAVSSGGVAYGGVMESTASFLGNNLTSAGGRDGFIVRTSN
jgi:hypothetical protein